MVEKSDLNTLLTASEVSAVADTVLAEQEENAVARAINLNANTGESRTEWVGSLSNETINELTRMGCMVQNKKDAYSRDIADVYIINCKTSISDNIFKLYPYSEVISHAKIININQFEQYIWIALPKEICCHIALYELHEMVNDNEMIAVDFTDKLFRENGKPWLKVEYDVFNMEIGFHIYKFSFVDTITDNCFSLYFAYHIQSDNPDKSSYVYMQRDGGDSK